MKKILVTGGLGYIGSHTVVDLVENGYQAVIIDNCDNSFEDVSDKINSLLHQEIKFHKLDLNNRSEVFQIFERERFDGVIHFAAHKSVGESMEFPFKYFYNNVNSLLHILEASKNHDIKAFIFSSSCTVYGDVKQSPVNENTPQQEAASVYGRTKQIGEQIIKDISPVVDFKSILLRYFNPAGSHESGLLKENPKKETLNLIPAISRAADVNLSSLKVFGNDYNTRDGSCIRDYIHVVDLAHAHTLALSYIFAEKQKEKVDVYNLGMGEGVTVFEAIKAYEKVTGKKVNFEIIPRRPGDVEAIYSDFTKAKNQLGWTPKYNIEDIMRTA